MCGEMPAFLSVPPGDGPAGAVIVIHERYGLTRHICELAQRFAADGYVAVAPDLYFRHPDQAALHRGDAGCDVDGDPESPGVLVAQVGDGCESEDKSSCQEHQAVEGQEAKDDDARCEEGAFQRRW